MFNKENTQVDLGASHLQTRKNDLEHALAQVALDLPKALAGQRFEDLQRELNSALGDPDGLKAQLLQLQLLPLDQQRLTLLDLVMISRALTQHGVPTPALAKLAIDTLAKELRVLPAVSYELIVLSNPPNATRTFCAGSVGKVEAQFYMGHRQIEAYCLAGVMALQVARNHLERGETEQATVLLTHATSLVRQATQFMRDEFLSLDAEAFNTFRPYLSSQGGYNGPSGLYSAVLHALRFQVFGNVLHARVEFIEQHRVYYPRQHDQILDTALQVACAKRGLAELDLGGDGKLELRNSVAELCLGLLEHTRLHFQVVRRLIPDLSGIGTGGQKIAEFLGTAIKTMKEAYDRIR